MDFSNSVLDPQGTFAPFGPLPPEWMANYAVDFCKKFPAIEVRVVDFEEMERRGMNLVRAVGKGAVHKPRIVYMHYKGDPDSEKTLALVGVQWHRDSRNDGCPGFRRVHGFEQRRTLRGGGPTPAPRPLLTMGGGPDTPSPSPSLA